MGFGTFYLRIRVSAYQPLEISMKPAVLPVAALGVAMSAFFLPPVLALTGATPAPTKPRAMLVVEARPVTGPTYATGRAPAGTLKAEPVRSRVPASPQGSPVPQFTRVASNADVVR
jgi:hypothetical protein